MIARRTVTFGTLALAVAPSLAHAASPEATAVFALTAALRRRGKVLEAALTLVNRGGEAVDVLVALGSQPAGHVQTFLQIEGEELELARVAELDRRDMLTRAGPRPAWAPLAAGGEVSFAPHRFSLPDGVEEELVAVAASFQTSLGTSSFRLEGLRWQKRES